MPEDASGSETNPDIAELKSAYRQFHELYFPRLLRYLLVVSRGREEVARDALQNTFVRVVRHVRCFPREEILWNWLTVLARSALVDEDRKQSRYRSLLDRFFRTGDALPAQVAPAADAELFLSLQQNLARLEPLERALVERKYFAGDSVRDIAETTGASENAIESRLVRIRRQLRQNILAQLNSDETDPRS
jgi:RNA polymerase sigma-70 factor (ECF subfamily)